ncbi:MAG TPA: hypothetical protein VNI02_00940 [Blastocatellia bacterium]|nr:hypothetical protein [Blastocatellia bacterium]
MRNQNLFVVAVITLSSLSAARLAPAQQTTTPASSQAPAAATARPCRDSEAYRQLDFWVGEWEVQGPKGKTAGSSSVQLILGDCVVFENWTGAGGYTGKSFNLYDAATRKWKQFWVDDRGGTLEFTGEFKDGAMRYTGESTAQDGKPVMDRLTFFPLAEGRVRQLWEQSPDKGKTWNTVFDGTYIRKKK